MSLPLEPVINFIPLFAFGSGIEFGLADDGGMKKRARSGYPSDVSDEEWAFVAPYLALCRQNAAQRDYALRDVFNALRYIAKTGSQWRFLPRSEEHTSELQSHSDLVCRLLLEKKKK